MPWLKVKPPSPNASSSPNAAELKLVNTTAESVPRLPIVRFAVAGANASVLPKSSTGIALPFA